MKKYVKRSILFRFAGFDLQLYYQRTPSQVFHKGKGYSYVTQLSVSLQSIYFSKQFHMAASLCISSQKKFSKQLHVQGQQYKK